MSTTTCRDEPRRVPLATTKSTSPARANIEGWGAANNIPNDIRPLVLLDSPQAESQMLSRHIEAKGRARGQLSILEAGCGNSWSIDLRGVRYTLTGIDLNQDALDIRKHKRGDLQEAVLGDLRTVRLEENRFDVIYNSFVLEHIENAEQVLDNFYRWLKPGGIILLRIPDAEAVYGFLSKVTPFWFHVFYKRYIAGIKTAGKPGYDPFPTVYDKIVSRHGIHRWCAAKGMTIREEAGWEYPVGRPGLVSLAVGAATKAMSLLSFGSLAADHVNLTFVIEKADADTRPSPTS
jgi:SAM-dependent methyltransferase